MIITTNADILIIILFNIFDFINFINEIKKNLLIIHMIEEFIINRDLYIYII